MGGVGRRGSPLPPGPLPPRISGGAPNPLSPGQSSLALWRLGRGERSRPLAPGKWGRNATCNPSDFERLHVLFLENLKGCRLGCTPLPRRQRARAPHSWAPKGEGHLQPPVPPPTLRRPAVLARPPLRPPTAPPTPTPPPPRRPLGGFPAAHHSELLYLATPWRPQASRTLYSQPELLLSSWLAPRSATTLALFYSSYSTRTPEASPGVNAGMQEVPPRTQWV